ncbi:PH domain-containing protein [Actinomadura scrupuli]|uniref:PH domain-containing protein n=1 Tax=Actinomadura scrupuli TaxID=559629 RepID=UPI003D963AA1
MDEFGGPPARQWRVAPVYPLVKAAGAVVCAVIAVVSALSAAADRQLVLLAGVAAAGLLVFAARDVLAPVHLSAGRGGLTVIRGFAGHRHIPWAEVQSIRLGERQRLGRTTRLVEIDTGERLHLLSSYDLGAQPEDVTEELRRLRFAAAGQSGRP